MMNWIEIYKDRAGNKKVMKNVKTGKEREVIIDQKERECIARGDYLQPVGKDKKKFFDKYSYLKENSKGEILDTRLNEKDVDLEVAEKEFKEREQNKHKIHKKYY